ncbi:MAG TPA: zinc-dependent alcohol dehydrogenase family protein [Mycobacteriales bacterium]|nr:zinc-dependent alcohol dehydrogenase family protein [Mycobacteriales bacterium]
MRGILVEQFGVRPQLRELPDPQCPPAGVVIRVAATGLCRSDWHGWRGHDPDIRLPHVPGHELAGTIAQVGPQVCGWAVGDRVTVPFVCACGVCPTCRRGEPQVCDAQFQPGFTHWGSFAELVAIDRAGINLIRLPPGVGFTDAAALGCRFSTAYRAVVAHGRVAAGDWVAVHGCGGVGLSAVMIAAAHGARVIAVDVTAGALRLAREVGAEAAVDASGTDVPAAVRAICPEGVAVSIDALGSTQTCLNSIRCLRKRGRHVQVGLMLADHAAPPVPMGEVIAGELEIIGSHGMGAAEYPALLAEIATGRLRPDRLVGRQIGLAEAADALATMDSAPAAGLTVIVP